MSKKRVLFFEQGNAGMRDLLGGKGAFGGDDKCLSPGTARVHGYHGSL